MYVYYFIQKYLDKLNDKTFMYKWEKWVIKRMFRFVMSIFFVYLFIVLLLGFGANEIMPGVFAIFLALVFGFFYGYSLIINTIRFLATNNKRYMYLKMDIPQVKNGINYDNIVG
jgi:hypothetical protein